MNRYLFSLSVFALSLLPATAATVIFDNSSAHPGGALTFGTAGAPAPVVLSNGAIDVVTKLDGSISSFPVSGNCGVAGVFGCLNLTTGSFLDQFTVGNTTTYQFNGGGALSITGSADGASGTLLSASGFDGIVTLNVNNLTQLTSLSGTLQAAMLNPVLAASLGVPANVPGGTNTNSAIEITITSGIGSGSSTTNSVQLNATNPVPEPASFALIGSAFAAIGMFKKVRAARS